MAASSLSAIAASRWVGCRRWIGVTGLSVAAAEQIVAGAGAIEVGNVDDDDMFSSFLSSILWYLKEIALLLKFNNSILEYSFQNSVQISVVLLKQNKWLMSAPMKSTMTWVNEIWTLHKVNGSKISESS